MSVNLSNYIPRLRRQLEDIGDSEHEEFLGDGSAEEFYLTAAPIKTGSVSVYLDDIATTLWSLNYDTGQLIFGTAPSSNVVIKVFYTSYKWSDTELVEYLEHAIEEAETLYDGETFTISDTAPYSYIDAAPTAAVLKLWYLIVQRDIALTNAATSAAKAISWRTDNMSVNRTAIPRLLREAAEDLETRIRKLAWDLTYNNATDLVVAGGETPGIGIVSVGESYVVEWKEYP